MEKYCISIDWLQTYCLGNEIQEGIYEVENHTNGLPAYTFDVRLQNTETAQFKRLLEVRYKNLIVATIQQCPRTSVINQRATLLKLSNRILYSKIYIELLYQLQSALGLTYKGITRVDVCYDCNYYRAHRSVPRFIQTFLSRPLSKKGSIYRRGSSKFAAWGSKSSTSDTKITSIRFGSEKSRTGAYIYDKTIELREVKDKPWIREMWKENGLVNTEDKHVWRSEISIKSEATAILNMNTGELFRLSPNYLEHYSNIQSLFHIYARKVFDFRTYTTSAKKSKFERMSLFEQNCEVTCKPYYMPTSADTGRMEKICYNKLQKLSREYVDLAEIHRIALNGAMDFLMELQGKKSRTLALERYTQYLNEFYSKKFINFEDVTYFGAMEALAETKRKYDAESLYEYAYLYPKSIRIEEIAKIEHEAQQDLNSISYLFT